MRISRSFSRLDGRALAAALVATLAGCGDGAGPSAPMGSLTPTGPSFPSGSVRLSYALDLPPGPGPFPAIVFGHGSGQQTKDEAMSVKSRMTQAGFAVLRYDKRGVGDSTGFYVERATAANLDNLAGDAVGALRVLSARRDVDPSRLGLVGGSQAGWIIPRAAAKSPLARFAVITSGPAVSVGEQEAYAGLTAQGALAPPPTDGAIRQGLEGIAPSGFDPRPDLERLSIPTLWLYGREDKTIYAPQSVEVLESLPSKPTVRIFPAAGHFILDTPRGLSSELPGAHRFATGLFPAIAEWLAALPAS